MAAQVEVVRGYVTADISGDHRIEQIRINTDTLCYLLSDIRDELVKLNRKFDECAMVVRKGNG